MQMQKKWRYIMKTLKVSKVISYGSLDTTAQVIVRNKTKHLRLVNGRWTCRKGNLYILPS